jgi:acetyltransferase-like isoleucine patch superfamily enzyme
MIKKLVLNFLFYYRQKKLKSFEPKMIYSYSHLGVKLTNTRISNSTIITNKQNLQLANYVFIGHYNFIESSNKITIDEGVQITNFISILTHSSHVSIRLYGYEYQNTKDLIGYKKGEVKIGKFTFIGPHSTIQCGTNIGQGSLVTAYSMVKGDFPDFSIISGNPGKVVGDTRHLDKEYLLNNPELAKFYEKWQIK